MITIGSLFTGIGLFDLGLIWGLTMAGLDVDVAYQVEIDPFCRGVLARHFPRTKRFEDVTKVRGADLPAVDVLCGGFPCQDISPAGRGEGIDGSRSGLWRDFARIIGETRPRFVCIENSSLLIARGLDRLVGDLERAGYDVEAATVRASDVGAPHRRERIFILAARRDRPADGMADPDRSRLEGTGARGSSLGGEGLAIAASERREPRAHMEPGSGGLARTELAGSDPQGSERRVADTDRQRLEGLAPIDSEDGGVEVERGDNAPRRGAGMADPDSDALRVDEQWEPRRRTRTLRDGGHAVARHDREPGGRHAQSRLGRGPDGCPAMLVRWPSRPGDAPAFWEPARAVTAYSPTRNARLHALGNAIVPQLVALRFGPRIAEILRGGS